MNRNPSSYGLVFCALAIVLGGCAKSDNASGGATATPAATATETATAAAIATAPAAGVAEASPAAAPAFTDIAGVNGQAEIVELAQLGVVDPLSGAFAPGQPVKRREFIRWLVKADNVLWRDAPAKQVRLADTTDHPAFSDVPATDPDFPYIQGMQDAGYSVGFPDGAFRPDAPLTREQMFAIKNVFDRGSVDAGLAKDLNFARNTAMPPWKDKQGISKTYVAAIATGSGGGAESFARVYGTASLFHPQLAVTRAQAAVAVSLVGDHVFYGSGLRSAAHPPPTAAP
jgi:hypothetical protein